ncbi:hypothetical protein Salat_0868100 [Sesamum alatum]|uniref:CCHC-type domain-containing protein n=1 Tax=Sesamum alatum TaxID=300844 RepID=A0AAE2CQR1_9LAMI|nr:hypothetical protein Salat_0868100 [Sesamum alatum]
MGDKVYTIVIYYLDKGKKVCNIDPDKYCYFEFMDDIRELHGISGNNMKISCGVEDSDEHMVIETNKDVLCMFEKNKSRSKFEIFVESLAGDKGKGIQDTSDEMSEEEGECSDEEGEGSDEDGEGEEEESSHEEGEGRRPKKSRRKEPGEAPNLVRRAGLVICKVCNQQGHNRRTCPVSQNKDKNSKMDIPLTQIAKNMKKRKRDVASRKRSTSQQEVQALKNKKTEATALPAIISNNQPIGSSSQQNCKTTNFFKSAST